MPSYDPKLLIDKDRVHEAEPFNQVDLSLEMRARVARPWLLCVRREPLNLGLEAIGFSQALVSLLIPLCTLAGCFQVLCLIRP
jgi:hypothetical protein